MNKAIVLLSMISIVAFSCQKAAKYKDALYITGTSLTTTSVITVDEGQTSTAISVSSSKIVNRDVDIQIIPDTTLVITYNQKHETKYNTLTDNLYSLSSNVATISSGSSVSSPEKIIINADNVKEGETYLLPIRIKKDSKSEGPNILKSKSIIYLVVHKIAKISAVDLEGRNYFKVDFSGKDDRLTNMTNITLECRVYVNSFQQRSPYISSLLGGEGGVLLRFGDVTIKPNQLQAAGSTPVQTDSKSLLSTHKWYSLAVVCDANNVKLYINGALDAKKTIPSPKTIDITKDFCIGRSYNGRYFDGKITECRIWSKALTENEIKSHMCSVDPTSPGLEAYWRMNEGQGDTAYDATQYKRNAVAVGHVEWESGIKCQ